MLAGRLPERDLREAIVVATRRYAKRQETWFRHQLRDAGSGKGETGNVWTLEPPAAQDALPPGILDRGRPAPAPAALPPAPQRRDRPSQPSHRRLAPCRRRPTLRGT